MDYHTRISSTCATVPAYAIVMKFDALATELRAGEKSPGSTADAGRMSDFALAHENSPDLDQKLESYGLILSSDGYVRWNNNNPDHPRNWPTGRKVYDTAVIIFLEFITYVAAPNSI